ncbi:helix-turn-helix domain-containing protein [Sinorhizobium meliloti]|uniref:helix-turn-helix domain-containing protein n=1 Tax=Rhizobium meliloti TaxID=382 RepID=UPI001F387ED0|nr:helix-turn-helix transcriptional regulator [Sinorhizobium meliloti]
MAGRQLPDGEPSLRYGRSVRVVRAQLQAALFCSHGIYPVEYVQALRIEEAKQMLETGNVAIEDVAASVGYEDPTFFRKLFKRRTGVTPAQYRQRNRIRGLPT